MPVSRSARAIALDILLESSKGRHYAADLLDARLSKAVPEVRDAALATQLVYGTIRMQGALDWMISAFSDRAVEKISPVVLLCLRLASFQLYYLERIPEYAAVNESVELAKTRENPGAGMFVNAVLRNFLAGRKGLRFPEKERDPVRHISVVHSHPQFLVERWVKSLGVQKTEEVCRIDNIPPPLFVRANTLKVSRDELIERLKGEGVAAEAVEGNPFGLCLGDCPFPSALPSFREGLFYVQDISAVKVIRCLRPQQDENVLDMCAAPGGKTTFIAQQMQKHGSIVACDSDPARAAKIEDNLRRLGISNVTVVVCDAHELPQKYPGSPFNRVLLDAPCSNTGVLRRRVEARWRLREDDFERLPRLQSKLLDAAAGMVKEGGVLVYSTCSIDPAENEEVSKAFLRGHKGFRMNFEETYFPVENGGDGGYVARFVRSA
jgi:16S rRNA (cytosine967-C5)-methyltransferase